MKKWCLLLLLLSGSVPAKAAETASNFIVLGMGVQNCTDYVDAYQAAGWEILLLSAWVSGYLTAVNEHMAYGPNVAAAMDSRQREQWLFRYCESHPRETLHDATRLLLQYLLEDKGRR